MSLQVSQGQQHVRHGYMPHMDRMRLPVAASRGSPSIGHARLLRLNSTPLLAAHWQQHVIRACTPQCLACAFQCRPCSDRRALAFVSCSVLVTRRFGQSVAAARATWLHATHAAPELANNDLARVDEYWLLASTQFRRHAASGDSMAATHTAVMHASHASQVLAGGALAKIVEQWL